MTSKDDIRLPEGYEDWVEVDHGAIRDHQITVTIMEHAGRETVRLIGSRIFVPPAPKPALPNVKPGAVVRFTHKAYGSTVQAIRWAASGSDWHVQFRGVAGVLCETYCGDTWLLNTVNADGFTVELDGL